MPRHFLLALACSLAVAAGAQPTWRFHLAFEDGTGAKDTLWLIYDTTAVVTQSHWPVNAAEYAQSQSGLDYADGNFHVYTINDLIDSSNSMAFPYSWFPIYDGVSVNAINWVPPMTITWDTSLFHAPYLPYGQGSIGIAGMGGLAFSQFAQSSEFGVFNMLIDDNVTVEFLWDYLFPFGVYFGEDDGVGIVTEQDGNDPLSIAPNPARSAIQIGAAGVVSEIRIMDLSGRTVLSFSEIPIPKVIDVSRLASGTYFVLARSPKNQLYHGKFQKVD